MSVCIEARALLRGRVMPVTLIIENGVVIESWFGNSCPPGYEKFSFTREGLVLLPGLIDLHVHLRGLNQSYKEDEYTGTAAAAAGGYTGVVDMPNTYPKINTLSTLRSKIKAYEDKALVNYGIHVGVPVERAYELLRSPVVMGLKIYPYDLYNAESVREASRAAGMLGKPVIVHCEHPAAVREGCRAGERWICRGLKAEKLCLREVQRLIDPQAYVHITHATSPELVYGARSLGFTVDTCPHYFMLSSDDERKLGCLGKVNPPLRPRSIADKMLELVADGGVDALVSDHAPHTVEEKNMGFDICPAGMTGLEAYSRIMLDLALRGLIRLELMVKLMSMGPARILGIRRYGCVENGCRANYTIINIKKGGVIRPCLFYSKAKYSPFEGYRHRGDIEATIVNGLPIYLDGELIPENRLPMPLGERTCPLRRRLWVLDSETR